MNAYTSNANVHSRWCGRHKGRSSFGIFALIVTIVALLSITGCIGLTSAGSPAANSSSGSGSAGTLMPSPTTLNFGNVVAGTSSPQTLTISNSGSTTVTLSQATVTGSEFSVVGGIASVAIAPGQNHAFQVQFAPASAGAASGSISITSNASNSPLTISLSGAGMTGLAIISQPPSQSVVAGQSATFTVVATGSGTVTYQWKKNGTPIVGATQASYITPATTSSDNGAQFTVVVTDNNSSLTSNVALLTVTSAVAAPAITSQPVSKTVVAGQTATFSVTATGSAPLTYQWNKNGVAISGATSASYTTPATSASDNNAQFTVKVSNSVSSVTSSAATLTVDIPPTISAQPASQTVTAGQSATFSVGATGTATLTYQWKKSGTAISGATSASYTTPATTSSDNGAQFTVTVTNGFGSVTSNAATLTVTSSGVAPSIASQPASKTVIAGQTATFSVTASGTGTLTYQWKKNGTAISGATSSSYTTPATASADNGAQFTVTVTNAVGSITSNAGTLTVTAATAILNANQTSLNFSSVNIGSSSSLPVTFTNNGNSSVTISNVSISGAGYAASGIQTGQIVTPGQAATLNVTFTPATAALLSGSVTVTSNASNSPATIALSGTGVQAVTHLVTLTWTASTSTVSGYNVYRSSVSGGPYTKMNSSIIAATTYVDLAVTAGQTYYYVVTAVDANAVESAYSAEVSATVP